MQSYFFLVAFFLAVDPPINRLKAASLIVLIPSLLALSNLESSKGFHTAILFLFGKSIHKGVGVLFMPHKCFTLIIVVV